MWNTIWHFTAVLLFRKPSSPSPKPPLTHSFPLAISFSYTDNKIDATQYLICKTVQYMSNRVIHSKETNIVFKMTMFCDEEVTKHISSSKWMKWKKVLKITHQYVPWQCFYSPINVTVCCHCAKHEGIWERGGTTPHIINPVLLHTMPSGNILATIFSMLTFLLLFNISLATKWTRWLFHSLRILVSVFLWVMIVSINYPQSLALSRTLAVHECVQSALHSACFTLA